MATFAAKASKTLSSGFLMYFVYISCGALVKELHLGTLQ